MQCENKEIELKEQIKNRDKKIQEMLKERKDHKQESKKNTTDIPTRGGKLMTFDETGNLVPLKDFFGDHPLRTLDQLRKKVDKIEKEVEDLKRRCNIIKYD